MPNKEVGTTPNITVSEQQLFRTAIGSNDINGKLPASQLPTSADIRLSVLGGSTSELAVANLAENEIAIDTAKNQIVYGDGTNIIYPVGGGIAEKQLFEFHGLDVVGSVALGAASGAYYLCYGTATLPSTVSVKTSEGYAKALRWDGTYAATSGSGASTVFPAAFGSAAASPYTTNSPHLMGVVACSASGAVSATDYLTFLQLSSTKITNLNLLNCSELETLILSLDKIRRLDLSQCSSLATLSLYDPSLLESISMAGSSSITNVLISDANSAELISFAGCTGLTAFSIASDNETNGVVSLDLSGCTSLVELAGAVNCPALTDINLSGCVLLNPTALNTPSFALSTNIKSLNLSGCASLVSSFGIPSLESLDISGCISLENLLIGPNIVNLSMAGCEALTHLTIQANTNITSLDLTDWPALTHFTTDDTALTELIVGTTSTLQSLIIRNNPALTALDLSGWNHLLIPGYAEHLITIVNTGITHLDINWEFSSGGDRIEATNGVLTSLNLDGAFQGVSSPYLFDFSNNSIASISGVGFGGFTYTNSSSASPGNFTNNQLTVDALYDFLSQVSVPIEESISIILVAGNPCVVDDVLTAGPGDIHTVVELEALALAKGTTIWPIAGMMPT